jgi:hypothetical protein
VENFRESSKRILDAGKLFAGCRRQHSAKPVCKRDVVPHDTFESGAGVCARAGRCGSDVIGMVEVDEYANGAYFAGPDAGTGPEDMDFLFRRIAYVPDFIASAGGLMFASGVEVHCRTDTDAQRHTRDGIACNVRTVLLEARAVQRRPLQRRCSWDSAAPTPLSHTKQRRQARHKTGAPDGNGATLRCFGFQTTADLGLLVARQVPAEREHMPGKYGEAASTVRHRRANRSAPR